MAKFRVYVKKTQNAVAPQRMPESYGKACPSWKNNARIPIPPASYDLYELGRLGFESAPGIATTGVPIKGENEPA
jgi:hypothetical protein